MGFISSNDNNTNKIRNSNSSSSTNFLKNLYDVSIVNESLADGELLSFQDGKWSNVTQTPTTYPFSLFQSLNQKGIANGYAGLDNNSQISIANIPDIPQSKITNLSTSLSTLTSGINLINNEIGHANGIASLDANGKLNTNQLPYLAIDIVTTVQTIIDRNNLNNVDKDVERFVILDCGISGTFNIGIKLLLSNPA